MRFDRTVWIAVLLVYLAGLADRAGGVLPPVPLFVESFECGDARRWSAIAGGSVPAGPPPGVFVPQVACSWSGPAPGDPFPSNVNVLATPLVADFPPGAPGTREVVFVTYNGTDGANDACRGDTASLFGVLRLADAATCAPIANVSGADERLIATATPAVGDLDNDGVPEIVALRARDSAGPAYGPVAFKWDPVDARYERWWAASGTDLATLCRWDGPVLHDLDDDGFAEVISGTEVFDGQTGARLDDGSFLPASAFGWPSVGDVDADGSPELVTSSLRGWNAGSGSWLAEGGASGAIGSTAYADFGTPSGASLDASVRDGIAEIVRSTASPSAVSLERLDGTVVFSVAGAGAGVPATGDFDGDDRAEVAVSSGGKMRVLDLDCVLPVAGCVGGFVRWETDIQDFASGRSTTTAVDLDLDGRLEAVFADECWVRVFDRLTGDVLASVARRSCTWSEGVAIASVGGGAELFVGSNPNCTITCPAIDPIQRGVRCSTGSHCPSGTCDAGYCRCGGDPQCPADHSCVAPPAGTPGTGNTCRANRTASPTSGFQVLREASGRWGATGGIWNQQPFSVTNVGQAGALPRTSDWVPNFLIPGRNDFRAADSRCAP